MLKIDIAKQQRIMAEINFKKNN